jgi:hypothetical protein
MMVEALTPKGGAIKKNRGDPGRVMGVRRKQIERVIRHRYGGLSLPDDYDGRAAAQLLLELGTDGVAIQRIARWATGDVLDRLLSAAKNNTAAWKSEDGGKSIKERIGQRIELTFDEFKLLGLTHVWPDDVDRPEIEGFVRRRRATNDMNRKRRKRALAKQNKPPPVTDPWDLPQGSRAQALALTALRDGAWWSVRALTEYARDEIGAFRELDHKAARQAVLRAVNELRKLGIVETKTQTEARGLKVLCARRPNVEPTDTFDEDDESQRDRPPRSAARSAPDQESDEHAHG